MPKTTLHKKPFCFLNKKQLVKLRLKALRAGVWFKALPRIDRALVDLTIKVASSVRSATLAKNILAVTRKLEVLLESRLLRTFKGVALQLAQKLSSVAQKWGNLVAQKWASDVSFIKFLAVMHINEPKTFKT
jgi:ribosome maturation protein Sdo1